MKTSIFRISLGLALWPFWAVAEPASLDADNIIVDDGTGLVEASGRAEARADGRVLKSESLTYNRETGTLTLPQGLRLREADGSLLQAMSGEIDNQLETGRFNDMRFTGDGARLRSDSAVRDGMQLDLRGAVFTSCPECDNPDDAPLWQIRAARIHYDRAVQNVSYLHSRLEVFGLPVFYLPFMAHAGPQVDRRSGVLAPSIGRTGAFGSYVEVPYFFDLAPYYDLTVTPRFSEKQDPFLKAEWRHLTRTGRVEATGYLHQPKDDLLPTGNDTNDTQGGFLANGRFQTGAWQTAFDIEQASDGLFFKRYKIFDPARLTSSLRVNRAFGRHRVSAEAYSFEDTIASESVQALMPRLSHDYRFENKIFGGRLALNNVFTRQQRDSDVDTAHLASLLTWSWRHISSGGFVWSAQNRLALDTYDFAIESGDATAGQAEQAPSSLSANSLALSLAYPLQRVGASDRQTLSPQAQLVLAKAEDGYDDIPFSATASRDLTRAQLFQPLAPKDEASRLNLGLGHRLDWQSHLSTDLFVGQSFNLSDEIYAPASGYDHDGNDRSALLARAALTAGPLVLEHDARFTDDGGALLRSESRFGLGFEKLSLNLDHSFYEAGQQGSAVLEEATGRVAWQIGKSWRLDASLRENLERKEKVKTDAAFTYEDDCTLARISFQRDYSAAGNVKPETSINFTFTLKTIGG